MKKSYVKAVVLATGKSFYVGTEQPYGYNQVENIDDAIMYSDREIEGMIRTFPKLAIIKLNVEVKE